MVVQRADTTTIDKFLVGTIKYLAEGFAKDKYEFLADHGFETRLYEYLDKVVGVRARLIEVPMWGFPGMAQMDELVEVLSSLLRPSTSREWRKCISQ